MSRYIDADAITEKKWQAESEACFYALEDVVSVTDIDDAPSIDIVRCKECRHRPIKEDVNGADYGFNLIAPNDDERCPCLVEDGWYSWMPEDDFFCGYGEREGE